MIRAGDVAQRLASSAEAVATMLIPSGKVTSGRLTAGNTQGERGESLSVLLTGPKAGQWQDFATGEGGDLIDLWAAVKRLPLAEAIIDAADYVGIKPPGRALKAPLKQRPIKPPMGLQKPTEANPAIRWAIEERKIKPASLDAYRIAVKGDALAFPALEAAKPGAPCHYIKYRAIDAKKYWSEPGGNPCLFGWQAIPENAREVLITEGEIDALVWHGMGFPALSPTNGAGSLDWIDREFDRLARFDRILLNFDRDAAGQEALGKVIERLGRERCFVVTLPGNHKDAGELAQAGGEVMEFAAAARAAQTQDPEQLVNARQFTDEVVTLFSTNPQDEPGVRPPWQKAEGLVFRRGELVILGGVNGHGKTECAGQLTLEAMAQGERCCVASLEFKPAKWLKRLTRQAAATDTPKNGYIHDIFRWYAPGLWTFSASGSTKARTIIDVFHYARQRYDIRWFVIDNLAKCGIDEDKFSEQKEFVEELSDLARDMDITILLVMHMRKNISEDIRPGKMDFKGSGGVTDMADTLLTIWRNKEKENNRRVAKQSGQPFDNAEEPDALFACHKQRNGETEPRVGLWFHEPSHQFLATPSGIAKSYVERSTAASRLTPLTTPASV